jgi:glycosyltransferase involved in cell wall biosynthesis
VGEVVMAGRVAFAGNAVVGSGGQGEFLRVMVHALEQWGQAQVYARAVHAPTVPCTNLPFAGGWRRWAFDAICRTPGLRRRSDWLTCLDDLDFDSRLTAAAAPADLFDGVMGQCVEAARRSPLRSARRIVTSLNTHVLHLDRVMRDEARRVGITAPTFVYPGFAKRVLEELATADSIRVCSKVARQTFIEHGVPPERLHVIPIGIDLDHFRPCRRGDDVFRVLVVASITPRKGVHYALEAFEQARLPNSELVIIGGTGDRWSRRLIADVAARHANIRLEGRDVTRDPVDQHYGRASVLLHAAVEDGFGLVIPQALACGRPVIATRESGASELIQDGKTGFVVDARDVAAIVDRLRLLHADAAIRERMSEAAPASVAHLSYDAHAAAVCALYRAVLDMP